MNHLYDTFLMNICFQKSNRQCTVKNIRADDPVKKVWIKFISSSYVDSTSAHLTPKYLYSLISCSTQSTKKYSSKQVVTGCDSTATKKNTIFCRKLLTIAQPVGLMEFKFQCHF